MCVQQELKRDCKKCNFKSIFNNKFVSEFKNCKFIMID